MAASRASEPEPFAMVRSYVGLEGAKSSDAPHLGGNIKVGDPFTYCPLAWTYLIERFTVRSMLDLGSGCGDAAAWFFRRGVMAVAVEGYASNVRTSRFPAVRLDLTKAAVETAVDLVHCQEVVEHIEEPHLGNLLASLTTGRIIVMTHALPGQQGYHHVNLQPSEYWVAHMKSSGCALLEEDTRRVRDLAEKDGAPYLAQSGLVFVNNSRL